MKKLSGIAVILFFSLGMAGCAATLAIRGDTSVYGMPMIKDAPKIIVGDIADRRPDKTNLGKIALLSLKTDKEINVLLTDRIAARLRGEGFNVRKVNMAEGGEEIKSILYENNGDIYLIGDLTSFNVSSFDALMEKAKGLSMFKIRIYDKAGKAVFKKGYRGYAEHWIGLTGAYGSAKSVEKTLSASVEVLFKDREFTDLLRGVKE